ARPDACSVRRRRHALRLRERRVAVRDAVTAAGPIELARHEGRRPRHAGARGFAVGRVAELVGETIFFDRGPGARILDAVAAEPRWLGASEERAAARGER